MNQRCAWRLCAAVFLAGACVGAPASTDGDLPPADLATPDLATPDLVEVRSLTLTNNEVLVQTGPCRDLTPLVGKGIVTDDRGLLKCGPDCKTSYPVGTVVTLTAIPDSATSRFVGWGGTCGDDPFAPPNPVCRLTVSDDLNVTAHFARDYYHGLILADLTNKGLSVTIYQSPGARDPIGELKLDPIPDPVVTRSARQCLALSKDQVLYLGVSVPAGVTLLGDPTCVLPQTCKTSDIVAPPGESIVFHTFP